MVWRILQSTDPKNISKDVLAEAGEGLQSVTFKVSQTTCSVNARGMSAFQCNCSQSRLNSTPSRNSDSALSRNSHEPQIAVTKCRPTQQRALWPRTGPGSGSHPGTFQRCGRGRAGAAGARAAAEGPRLRPGPCPAHRAGTRCGRGLQPFPRPQAAPPCPLRAPPARAHPADFLPNPLLSPRYSLRFGREPRDSPVLFSPLTLPQGHQQTRSPPPEMFPASKLS